MPADIAARCSAQRFDYESPNHVGMVGMPAQMQEELCDQGEWEATPDGKRWPKPCARQSPTAYQHDDGWLADHPANSLHFRWLADSAHRCPQHAVADGGR